MEEAKMEWWRKFIVKFCRWRVERNGRASSKYMNFCFWLTTGEDPGDYDIV